MNEFTETSRYHPCETVIQYDVTGKPEFCGKPTKLVLSNYKAGLIPICVDCVTRNRSRSDHRRHKVSEFVD